jgi:hypothetical protein
MRRTQLGLRVDDSVLERLDACAVEMARRAAGAEIVRADAGRAALLLGLDLLEAKLGLEPSASKGAKPVNKPKR